MTAFRSQFVEMVVFRRKPRQGCEFLLLRRSDGEPLYPGIWQVISGKQKRGESAVRSAVRELQEETGLRPRALWSLPLVNAFYGVRTDALHLAPAFAAEVGARDTVQLSPEHQEYRWVTQAAAAGLIVWPSHGTMMALVSDYIVPDRGFARHTRIPVERKEEA